MELESERRRNMIFDSISNKENYKEEKEIYQTLNFLEKLKKWDDAEGLDFGESSFIFVQR